MATGNNFSERVWIYRGKPSDTPNYFLFYFFQTKQWAGLGKRQIDRRGTDERRVSRRVVVVVVGGVLFRR
jgi:hypothetical protein